ncbi:MAG: tetratricopeptide repeat protein [Oleibacter sp.]|nr:tetratricopeptide repeat protein [Thalassolituus sp.]
MLRSSRLFLPFVTVLATASFALSGCSTFRGETAESNLNAPINSTADGTDKDQSLAMDKDSSPSYRPFPKDTLTSLLTAEFAGQRHQFDVALKGYLREAEQTGDAQVAERALRIAQYTGKAEAAQQASQLWLASEPDNPGAIQAAAQVALGQKEYQKSLALFTRLYETSGVAQYDFYAATISLAPESDREIALVQLSDIAKSHPKEANVLYAQGILEQSLERTDLALQKIDKALKLQPNLLPAAIQKARILGAAGREADAVKWLTKVRKENPNNKAVALLRANFMLKQEKIDDAGDAYQDILKRFPADAQVTMALALIREDQERYVDAKKLFNDLLRMQQNTNSAYFYLGRIAIKENDNDLAINYFIRVTDSREYLPAQVTAADLITETRGLNQAIAYLDAQAQKEPKYSHQLKRIESDLLIKADRLNEALDALSQAIDLEPNDTDLRYIRALIAERVGDNELMESDLKFIIAKDPKHAEARNALGYSLANRGVRLDESELLLLEALELQPDNAAVIDSLGWLYFRKGMLNEAGPLLLDAWNRMKDHEVAAHLGEWYWTINDQATAKEIWREGLSLKSDSEVLLETLERFDLSPEQL